LGSVQIFSGGFFFVWEEGMGLKGGDYVRGSFLGGICLGRREFP